MSKVQKPDTEGGSCSRDAEIAAPASDDSGREIGISPMMEPERQAEVLLRLAKAAGQVQGISRMVSADRSCVDVLTQIAAVQKALDGVASVITRNFLERRVTDVINGGDPLIYDELMRVIERRR